MTGSERERVQEALRNYCIRERKVTLIRHNENITCQVVSDENTYVLRIHLPMEGFSLKLLETVPAAELMEGEVELLRYLAGRAPFPVQLPVRNRRGSYVTLLSGGIPCELLQWVEGRPMDKENANDYAGQLGALAAQLHRAARGFTGTRPSYSHDLVRRMRREFELASRESHITGEQESVCQAVLDEADRVMTVLDKTPGAGSLIHADLSFGNVLLTPSGPAPIDFSLSGFGYKAQECGMLAANYRGRREWERIRESYGRESGFPVEPHHMHSFMAFSVLLFIAAQHNRFWRERLFRESMARWTGGLFQEVR